MGSGERVAYFEERPAFIAKNRYTMPSEVTLPRNPAEVFGAVAQHIPYFSKQRNAAAQQK